MHAHTTHAKRADRLLLALTLLLAFGGFIISSSASLGIVALRPGLKLPFDLSQFFALIVGLGALRLTMAIPFARWRTLAFPFFIVALVLTLLVFVPGIGFSYGGATRWIHLGPLSLQPSELLKLAFTIYLASWLAATGTHVKDLREGFAPFCAILAVVGLTMLAQPDTGTFLIMAAVAVGLFIIAGGRWLHLGALALVGILCLGVLAVARPYVRDRIETFFRPGEDTLGASYQINQSLIAIGSGGFFGRGYGQSIQKFSYLPEPIGDSVFAVAGEEFGFFGSALLVLSFLLFGLWGLKIASQVPNSFGRLLLSGITLLIVSGAFLNIGSMIGILPLTGVPLSFVSHGGTALVITLAGAGIALQVSMHRERE